MKPRHHRILALNFAALALLAAAPARADAPSRTYAQALVDQAIGENPGVFIIGMHAVKPGTSDSAIIASNIGRIGKKDDEDDLDAFRKDTPVFEPVKEKHRYEVLTPMREKSGRNIGVLGIVFKWEGHGQEDFLAAATRIRDRMEQEIPSLDALFKPAGDALPLLVPNATVLIPDSKGKFDFLEVDSVYHRLLAAHEKDDTADFIDLDSNRLITRLKTGPAVHMVLDPRTDKYFISASEDKKVLIVDPTTLEIKGSAVTEGELDAITVDSRNHLVYVTNDEATHVWGIDPVTAKVVATIDIPSAPEYMIYDAGADRIYLNLKKENEIAVIDPAANAIVAHWATAPATSPHGLAFDPVTGRLFAAGQNGELAVIDSKTGKPVTSVKIAPGVDQNVFDITTRRIYCACGGTMSIVQETDAGAELLGSIPTAATAKNVAVDPANHTVWTTYTDGTNSYAQSWHP